MRVRLKGLNRTRKRLADGSEVTYYYAGKGGPRIHGEPGSPEFIANFHAAASVRSRKTQGTLNELVALYEQSPAYLDLAGSTRKTYARYLRKIEADFGDLPVAALSDQRVRGDFLAWRDKIAARSRRQADHAFVVLARVISWSYDRGLAPANPCLRPGRLYRVSRTDKVWTDVDEAAFYNSAPSHLHLALGLALWTGQRQGDLLRLKWSQYDGQYLRLKQGKSGSRVLVPVGEPLRVALDAARDSRLAEVGDEAALANLTILANRSGDAWTSDGFRTSWGKACRKAGIVALTFHDLRGTAVTRLAIAGCTVAEIATISGHSLKDVESILDAHYLKRDSAMAVSAIRKLEESQARSQLNAQLAEPGPADDGESS